MAALRFEQLYEDCAPMVYWMAHAVLHNHESAQEMVQAVFLKAHEHWNTLVTLQEAQAKKWLYRTCKNASIDRIRKERRELMMDAVPERLDGDETVQPEAATLRHAQEERIYALIQALPVLYREPVLMHYFAGLSQQEAAAALQIGGGTYRSRLARARLLLKDLLEREGIGLA